MALCANVAARMVRCYLFHLRFDGCLTQLFVLQVAVQQRTSTNEELWFLESA